MSFVVPAVLPSSHKDLEERLAIFAQLPSVDRVQIDVVDGRFATPASWPYSAPEELDRMVQGGEMLPYLERFNYEIDLMCLDAPRAAESWLSFGASRLTLHAESAIDMPRLLASLQEGYGRSIVSYGLALNLESDPLLIEPCLDRIDYVQFMGIAQIGRQGQLFDRRVFERVRAFHARYPEMPLQIDGGVSLENAEELLSSGASSLIVGSAILRAKDPSAALAAFEALESPFGV
ncbi:MAG: beta/alpha barrel domain-containing protein [Minisyncoccota bacterium]